MSALALVALQAALAATSHAADVPMAPPAGRPGWADEFDGTALDAGRWKYDTSRNKAGWFNGELQYYSAGRPGNVRVADGLLRITARREDLPAAADWGGQHYSSARIMSRVVWGHGFYEVRAKLPCAAGTWPAIWMVPGDDRAAWPDDGEIDIMEQVGSHPNVVDATLHTALFNHARHTQRGAQTSVPTSCTAFHRYQLDWRRDAITIGVDGHGYMRVANDRPGGHGAWPFDAPFRMILNLALGGGWAGTPDDTALPQSMQVDYVRVWPTRTAPERR